MESIVHGSVDVAMFVVVVDAGCVVPFVQGVPVEVHVGRISVHLVEDLR